MPARYLDEHVSRYDVISAVVWQDLSHDPRPESWKIDPATIEKVGHIGTGKGTPPDWYAREDIVCKPDRCFSSIELLQEARARDGTSVGLVKPRPGARASIKNRPARDRQDWQAKHEEILAQEDLFDPPKSLEYMPKRPFIRFKCEGAECTTTHECAVLDWEVYQLARKSGWEAVKEKLALFLDQDQYDTRFIMGNFRTHLQNFGVVGLWYPKRSAQPRLL
jgi:hypothetical protein